MFLIPILYLACYNLIQVLLLQPKSKRTTDCSCLSTELRHYFEHFKYIFSSLDVAVLIIFLVCHILQISKSSYSAADSPFIFLKHCASEIQSTLAEALKILKGIRETLCTTQTTLPFVNLGRVIYFLHSRMMLLTPVLS